MVVRRRPRPASVLDVATLARSFPQLHDALFTAALFELCWFSDDEESHTVQRFGLLVTSPPMRRWSLPPCCHMALRRPSVRPATPLHHHTYRGVDTRLPRRPAPHRHDALKTIQQSAVIRPRRRRPAASQNALSLPVVLDFLRDLHRVYSSPRLFTAASPLFPSMIPSCPRTQRLPTDLSISPSRCSTRSSRQTTSPGRSPSTSSPPPASLALPSFLKFVEIFP